MVLASLIDLAGLLPARPDIINAYLLQSNNVCCAALEPFGDCPAPKQHGSSRGTMCGLFVQHEVTTLPPATGSHLMRSLRFFDTSHRPQRLCVTTWSCKMRNACNSVTSTM